MQETLHDHGTSISIGGRPICSLQFADSIDLMGGRMVNFSTSPSCRLVDRATAYGMEVGTEKSKITIDCTNNISADNSVKGQKLEEMSISSTWDQLCAKMAPAQRESESGLP